MNIEQTSNALVDEELVKLILRKRHMKVAEHLKNDFDSCKFSQFKEEFKFARHSQDACMIKLFLMHRQRLKKLKYQK